MTFQEEFLRLMKEKELDISEIRVMFGVCTQTVIGWMIGRNAPHPAMQKVVFKELSSALPREQRKQS